MIPSRELSARPGEVWKTLAREGAVVITRDGMPVGIITPTSEDTLLEDMQELIFSKARHAVSTIRAAAAEAGTGQMSGQEIDAEIHASRKALKRGAGR